ncbi:ABC transporter ATP-binding protein [Candidatus Nanohalovita haloferacivicina]|uniref:ABC transporter ATP-binding protein n=1 Tax=Candidatus Nanohalovita haloferacivicina TaxID=2978046 RepID=UPI00325FDF36|nr:ABC-type antimicrobial peptide transport system,ATPase component [Candidatus Nanohalobia archaeon BNXNv]
MALINLEDVVKEYQMGENIVQALRGSNLQIEEGDFVAIMGPSGSGKSTLMNMVGALDVPTRGKVTLDDNNLSDLSENELARLRSEKVGFVFQKFNLISSMTAQENVALPMLFRGASRKERMERSRELLERMGLEDRLDHMPSELSGGQQQRVSIARALVNDPEIILADEPTGNLDTETGDKVMDLLKELNEEEGKTIIMVTHDPHDAQYAQYIVDITDGVTTKKEKEENYEYTTRVEED